ncbi:hypothetical protein [Brevibacillus choshinensis]|uniref:Uncharacterized protein n=1 Tax=Brevibacillus choshinensis TaxID=54911 RepID=A0ABX7FL27_BRECH|nr:hypothetical protein [Brevibacillus choshinensis]QRG66540.1 hypothetical protein JNE38_23950 [Brevibacillus choshinensis]
MEKRQPQSGEVAAALGGLWLGLAGVVFSHLWSTVDPAGSKPALLKLGIWIPGWWGIGPFAGKETVGLAMWLGGWLALHFLLRRREVPVRPAATLFVIGFGFILILAWPPVYHALLGWPPGLPE